MKPLLVFAIAFVAFLTGCSGGGGTAPPVSSQTSSQSSSLASTTSAVESNAQIYTASVPVSNDLLYVSNQGTGSSPPSITVYHHDTAGNSAPLYVIAGSKTGLNDPGPLSEDAQGNLYVANGNQRVFSQPVPPVSILVFAHGANGNVAPIRTISGPATLLHYDIGGLTVDQSTGKIFVVDTDAAGEDDGASLLRFPPNSSGNQAPFAFAKISNWAYQLASDSTGLHIIEAASAVCCSYTTNRVATMDKQFANNTPIYTSEINAFVAIGVADDPTTKTFLVSSYSGIMRFAEGTNGNGPYTLSIGTPIPASYTPAIVSTITSETCGGNLALGYLRNIYIVDNCGAAPAIKVYTHDSSGNVPPLRMLSGLATRLSAPVGIYEGQ